MTILRDKVTIFVVKINQSNYRKCFKGLFLIILLVNAYFHCLYLEMRNSKSLSLKNIGQNGFFTSRGVNFLLGPKTFFGSFMEKMKVEDYLVEKN